MFEPLSKLRATGFCCPCIEDEDHYSARIATYSLQSLSIRWYRKVIIKNSIRLASSSSPRGNNGIMGEILSGISKAASSTSAMVPTYIGFDATLSLIDTRNGPCLVVTSNDNAAQLYELYDFVDMEADHEAFHKCGAAKLTQILNLKDVDSAAVRGMWDWSAGIGGAECDVKVFGLPSQFQLLGPGKKVLQFDVVPGFMCRLDKEEVVEDLNALVKWNRSRIVHNVKVKIENGFVLTGDKND